jgi:hypothetical protein
VITGRVKGPPKISKDGSAVVVKKVLDDGATVQETFPKHRVRGKQKQLKQLIPAEEVLRTIEEATATVASAVRTDGERKLKGLQDLANKVMDEEIAKVKRKAGGQTKRAVKAAVAARAQTSKARERARQAMSFAETVARHVNGDEDTRRFNRALRTPQDTLDIDG